MDHTPIDSTSSTVIPGNNSELTTMDVDSTPVTSSPKGKDKKDSTPPHSEISLAA
jgi:hypothetical protein